MLAHARERARARERGGQASGKERCGLGSKCLSEMRWRKKINHVLMFDVLVQMANGEEEEEESFGELLLRRRLLLCRIAVTTLNNNRLTHPPATRASGVVRVRDTHVLCVCTEPGQTRASLSLSLSLSLGLNHGHAWYAL